MYICYAFICTIDSNYTAYVCRLNFMLDIPCFQILVIFFSNKQKKKTRNSEIVSHIMDGKYLSDLRNM